MLRIGQARVEFQWSVIWERWLFGVEFLAFPWWGSAYFGPFDVSWSRASKSEESNEPFERFDAGARIVIKAPNRFKII